MLSDYSIITLLPVEMNKASLPEHIIGTEILKEDKNQISIFDASVVGDYVYYWGDVNATTHLYRIKIDGTNWSQLY